uniref:Uncharacterized protein n=1 Tax=viral metagenome TaxID=1070528 RepID=A0A6C0J6A7_9ZZZZ
MNKQFKIFIVVSLILCFLIFLYFRRKKMKEHFECMKIDDSITCLKANEIDKAEINLFRKNQDSDYKDSNIKELSLYNFIDFTNESIITQNINCLTDYTEYTNTKQEKFKQLKYEDNKLLYKYDYIELNGELNGKLIGTTKKIISPGGVLFDKYNDEIIVFDIYRLRRYSYRDMKIKANEIPVLDATPLEILTQNDKDKIEFLQLLKSLKDETYFLSISITTEILPENSINKTLKNIRDKLEGLDETDIITIKYNGEETEETEETVKELLEKLKVLEEKFIKNKKYKDCINDLTDNKDDKKCSITYQNDLPQFDMGGNEGKGVEGMHYDDDQPPTIIHSSYLDNKMQPWMNSWNNVKMEGVFSPMITNNDRRMRIIRDSNFTYSDFGTPKGTDRGKIEGIKQESSIVEEKTQLFNKTIINPLTDFSGTSKKTNNFYIETFQNQLEYTELASKDSNNKVNYGYPSIELDSTGGDTVNSIGVYHIPDEMDTTGIGMELVKIEDGKIILVPDINNNRIQVFKIDKSEVEYFGQFGNLDYTSQRSLPLNDNNTKYEQIHDTEKHNSLPGCEKTCSFDTIGNYTGGRNKDFMNRKCLNWDNYKEATSVKTSQFDTNYGLNPDFGTVWTSNFNNNKDKFYGNKCKSLDGVDDKQPVCIVSAGGDAPAGSETILSQCFPNKDTDDAPDTSTPVKDQATCEDWLEDYTSKFGPIDNNVCLGDDGSLPGAPESDKCVFECDYKYSYRRANIHQRQTVFIGDKEVSRKRGHFYSLLDEYNRCKDGIQLEKDTKKPKFNDAEFINPHFLGVNSQACIGAKSKDGDCDRRDTRDTSGIDNCSIGYRKYLLKVIAATNNGQMFGQLFKPKSIAYDDVDEKYYVVDCYHHSVQCYELEDTKIKTESGEKLNFVSADKPINENHIFYYDSNFNTNKYTEYNKSEIYSLGLRQNLIYDNPGFDKFSRNLEDLHDMGAVKPTGKKTPYMEKVEEFEALALTIPTKINEIQKAENYKIFEAICDEILKLTDAGGARQIGISDLQGKLDILSNKFNAIYKDIGSLPLNIMNAAQKLQHKNFLNNEISNLNRLIARKMGNVTTELEAKAKTEKLQRSEGKIKKTRNNQVVDITDSSEWDSPEYLIDSKWNPKNDYREYPLGYWLNQIDHDTGWLDGDLGFSDHPGGGETIITLPKKTDGTIAIPKALIIQGRNYNHPLKYIQFMIDVEIEFSIDKTNWVQRHKLLTGINQNNLDTWTVINFTKPAPDKTLYVKIIMGAYHGHRTMRTGIKVQEKTFDTYWIAPDGKEINIDGTYVNASDNTSWVLEVPKLVLNPYDEKGNNPILSEGFSNMDDLSKEKGLSIISKAWGLKYADSVIRLNRWVSGISQWGNHVFKSEKQNNVSEYYQKINKTGDYFFNTELGGSGSAPGCGEFSYPSDIAITKNSYLGNETQLMFITDTGNNRVSIFKKYKLGDHIRFRFYRFLGDDEKETIKLVNPISVCVSSVSGNVFVLESNFYNNKMNYTTTSNDIPSQRIRVYYSDKTKQNYYYSHDIQLNGSKDKYADLNKVFGDNDKSVPRITKIRIDDRGILALTDINNDKVHLLKESIGENSNFEVKNIDDLALNKVVLQIEFDPYKSFKSYKDKESVPIINHDRIRFVIQRQRVCAFQDSDVVVSKEFKTKVMPLGENNKTIFDIEDIIQENTYDNCWVMDTDSSGVKYIDEDKDIDSQEKTRTATNRPNFNIDKQYNDKNELNNYEDWQGKSLAPNSSYLYKVFVYNYNYLIDTEKIGDKVVQTFPVYLNDGDVNPTSIMTDTESYISLGISYKHDSKKFNPICFTIMRRIHNRTADICTKNINCLKETKIQLFLPRESKIIFQTDSRPKFGRLKVFDIDKGGEFDDNLVEIEKGVEYGNNKYLIFYCCIGGDEKVGGVALPDAKSSGRDHIIDTFIMGDRLETVHNQVSYIVHIDLKKKPDNRVVLFKDNETTEDFIKYYKKNQDIENSTDLKRIVKLSYAKKLNNSYYYPGTLNYCDKGINNGNVYQPIEMNQTYEYIILVSNPFKVNPAVNSFYYTTKPEKPYIHSVKIEKEAMENDYEIVENQNVGKIMWYYPKNRSLYWPLSFLVLRKELSNNSNISPKLTYDIDFTLIGNPLKSDTLFRIMKKSLKLINNSDPTAVGTFKRRYNLGKQMDWKITIFGTPGIQVVLNKKNYIVGRDIGIEINTKFLDLEITLEGQNEITNIKCEETVIDAEVDVVEDDVLKDRSPIGSVQQNDKIRKKELKKLEDAKHKKEIKTAVEDFRKSDGPNFIFRLNDDYFGYYTNVVNAPKSGRSGALYNYIKDMTKEELLNIYDELSNEMKIYSGDVGLRMDGEGRTLRSGDKDMLIDKIRHFAFILRESQNREDKMMGIECNELNLDDIKIVTSNTGGTPTIKSLVCKSANPTPTFTDSAGTANTNLTGECENLGGTGYKGNPIITMKEKMTLGECCYILQNGSNELGQFIKDDDIQNGQEMGVCNIYKNYSIDNETTETNSTLLGKTKGIFTPKTNVESPPPSTGDEDEIIIPPGKSEWEIMKVIQSTKRTGESFQGSIKDESLFRPSLQPNMDDKQNIQTNFSFNPTIVSLASDPEKLGLSPSTSNIEFSSHEVMIPIPIGKRYAYKIGVYQSGFCMDSKEKKDYLGVETKDSLLGIGEIYSSEIEMGESIQDIVMDNKPPLIAENVFEEIIVEKPVIKFFEPKEGDSNSIVRLVGLKLDKLEYFSFRDVKVPILKKQERIIGNVKYQEYLFKPPSIKDLDRNCWQSLEKYKVLVWGYHHGHQIISSEGDTEKTKMFTYSSSGECEPVKK